MDRTNGVVEGVTRRRVLRAGGLLGVAAASVAGCDVFSTDPAGRVEDGAAPDDGETPAKEAPMLARRVEENELPPVDQRLPETPLVVEPVERTGVYGGEWRRPCLSVSHMSRPIGYEQVMSWDRSFSEPVSNLAESVDVVDEGREYVIRLRSGVKWSDGAPFTADDIVFAYDDVLGNEELYPVVPSWLAVGGEPAAFEKVDDVTIRVRFAEPSGLFLQSLATPDGRPLAAMPRHYLEQFHADYASDAPAVAESEGYDHWAERFFDKADQWEGDSVTELPTLFPWRIVKTPEGGAPGVAERNPYYWKVDSEGRQLPYLDRVVFPLVESEEVILLQTLNGEIDMCTRYFNTLRNKPVLAKNRKRGDYHFFDMVPTYENQLIVAFNLTHKDPVKREVFSNKEFRIGLSYAINRDELISAVYQQQGEPWQAAPRREGPFFDEEFAKQYTEFDIDRANEHLDQAGYVGRDEEGFRLGPDGSRIAFGVDVAVESDPSWADAVELIGERWREVGIELRIQHRERSFSRTRVEANEHDAVVWRGAAGLTDAILDPRWILPVDVGAYYGIPWANWYTGSEEPREEPPAATRRQLELYDEAKGIFDVEERRELFRGIMQIAKDEFYVIGTVLTDGYYGIAKNNFRNVMEPMPAGWQYPHPGPSQPEQYFISDS